MRRISVYSSSVRAAIVRRVFFMNFILRSSLFSRSSVSADLAWQAFYRAEIYYQMFGVGMMRVGIRVAAHFGEGVEGVIGFAVIAEGAIAFADLL